MHNEQRVIRLEMDQHLEHLGTMRNELKKYKTKIQRLKKYYDENGWEVPLSSYINFRDALCHYAAACHREELIELRQDGNAIEEHLHRAVKDMAVNYLQVLGRKIANICSYTPAPEDSRELEEKPCVDFFSYVEELEKNGDYKAFLQALRWYYVKDHTANYRLLQKYLHKVRQFDLDRRESSLRIKKPYSAGGLDEFYDLVAECKEELRKQGLYQLVFHYGDFFDLEETTPLWQD